MKVVYKLERMRNGYLIEEVEINDREVVDPAPYVIQDITVDNTQPVKSTRPDAEEVVEVLSKTIREALKCRKSFKVLISIID